jgi:hypothetical protein
MNRSEHGDRSTYSNLKCRCEPCTQANTQDSKERYARRARLLKAIKMAVGCVDCGYDEHPEALHFDHLPEYEKLTEIGNSNLKMGSIHKLLGEIAKCDVVCANCHAVRTAVRREGV